MASLGKACDPGVATAAGFRHGCHLQGSQNSALGKLTPADIWRHVKEGNKYVAFHSELAATEMYYYIINLRPDSAQDIGSPSIGRGLGRARGLSTGGQYCSSGEGEAGGGRQEQGHPGREAEEPAQVEAKPLAGGRPQEGPAAPQEKRRPPGEPRAGDRRQEGQGQDDADCPPEGPPDLRSTPPIAQGRATVHIRIERGGRLCTDPQEITIMCAL